MRTVFFAALAFILCSCAAPEKRETADSGTPSTLDCVIDRDWSINRHVIRDSVFKSIINERTTRSGLFTAESYISSGRSFAVEDVLTLLDRAAMYAASAVYPEAADDKNFIDRRHRWVKICSDIELCKLLEEKKLLTAQEREQYTLLKLELAVELECDGDKFVGGFGFATLPDSSKVTVPPELPSGFEAGGVLTWIKFLFNLPQEIERGPKLDRRKLACIIIDISKRFSHRAAAEALKVPKATSDDRDLARMRYRERLLAARCLETKYADHSSSEELRFLRDIYTLTL